MLAFFDGWRRKIGVLMLVVACAFLAAWVRSCVMYDHFFVRTGTSSVHQIDTVRGKVSWMRLSEEQGSLSDHWHQSGYDTNFAICRPEELNWRRQLGQFEIGEFSFTSIGQATYCIVPHSSFVIPLTLISACLLLSKPRPRKTPEPENSPDNAQVTHA